jgi:hypothetical protein
MPTTSTQNLNIDDLLQDQKKQNELRQVKTKAKRAKQTARILPFSPKNAESNKTQSSSYADTPATSAPNVQQNTTAENQAQPTDKEEKTKKLRLWQIRKRQKAIGEIKKLDAKLKKLEKLTGKYKSTNWLFLALLAGFIELADLPINFFWGTTVLIPLALFMTAIKQITCLFIWIKIHKIKSDQKTNDQWWWTLIAIIIGIIPGINALPETFVRVKKAHNAAKAAFEEHESEIKKTQKEMGKLMKQLR